MRKFLPLVLVLLALFSCGRRSRVIPASTLSDIYADMFMADQWLSQNSRARRTADTSNFYAPILREYGYTVEDYDASVKHYLRKPDKYAKILKAAGAKLSKKAKRLEAIEDALLKRVKFSPYKPSIFCYDTLRFKDDTLGLWPNDSSFAKDAPADTLAVSDTLAAPDSLAVAVDTLTRVKPLSIDIKKLQTNDQPYGKERHSEEMLLIHGSDDTPHRGHSDLREIPRRQSEQAR